MKLILKQNIAGTIKIGSLDVRRGAGGRVHSCFVVVVLRWRSPRVRHRTRHIGPRHPIRDPAARAAGAGAARAPRIASVDVIKI